MVISDTTKPEAIEKKGVYSVNILKPLPETASNSPQESVADTVFDGKDKAFWYSRLKVLENEISLQKEKVQNVQLEIDSIVAARLNEVNPLKYMEQNQKIAELEKSIVAEKNILTEKEDDLDAFLAEARAAGVPPGWLRD